MPYDELTKSQRQLLDDIRKEMQTENYNNIFEARFLAHINQIAFTGIDSNPMKYMSCKKEDFLELERGNFIAFIESTPHSYRCRLT